MKAPERLATARLLLTRPTAADAPVIFARYASDPAVTRYLGWPRHTSLAMTEQFVAFSDTQWRDWPAGPYLLRDSDERLVGGTGLMFEESDVAMTGYVLARDAWGLGFATEALLAMVALAPPLGVRRLHALCHPDHAPSRRVLEKAGFTCEGTRAVEIEFPNLAPGVLQPAVRYDRVFTRTTAAT